MWSRIPARLHYTGKTRFIDVVYVRNVKSVFVFYSNEIPSFTVLGCTRVQCDRVRPWPAPPPGKRNQTKQRPARGTHALSTGHDRILWNGQYDYIDAYAPARSGRFKFGDIFSAHPLARFRDIPGGQPSFRHDRYGAFCAGPVSFVRVRFPNDIATHGPCTLLRVSGLGRGACDLSDRNQRHRFGAVEKLDWRGRANKRNVGEMPVNVTREFFFCNIHTDFYERWKPRQIHTLRTGPRGKNLGPRGARHWGVKGLDRTTAL